MKTQIITLESHDDLVSVRDRMSWAKSPRILLVWPRFERITLRPLDLRILQQHAVYLGADLGLVTRSGNIWREAKGFGIPVFRSTAKAQRDVWRSRSPARAGRRRGPAHTRGDLAALRDQIRKDGTGWTATPVARIGFFLIGVLAALALAAVFVPRATILLTPVTRTQELSLPAEASTKGVSSVVAMSLPAQEMKVTVSGTQSIKITSRASVPQDKARGVAHFQNLTLAPLVIPAGTVVYSVSPTGVRYATLNETRLEGQPKAFVEVPIQALDGGQAGNVPADTIDGIEGSLSLSASVANPEPITGGSDRMATVASQADRDRLRSQMLGVLNTNAEGKLQDSVARGDLLLQDTVKMADAPNTTYDPAAGQPGDLLSLTLSAEYTAQYVKAEDLKHLAEASLNSSMPVGFRPVPDTLKIDVAESPQLTQDGKSRFTLDLRRGMVRDVDLSHANAIVRGLSPAVAADRLKAAFQLSRRPEVSLNPPWWPWLPLIPFRITIGVP
jgi:hypothetical protein